jgi:hypothetical protein
VDNLLCYVVLAFAWLVSAIAASTIAGRKGNSEAWGAVVGGVLGPVGVALMAVLPPNQGVLERRQLQAGQVRQCPFCAELVKRHATVCRFCGRDLPAV